MLAESITQGPRNFNKRQRASLPDGAGKDKSTDVKDHHYKGDLESLHFLEHSTQASSPEPGERPLAPRHLQSLLLHELA